MYWPCGVPRIFAYSSPEKTGTTKHENIGDGMNDGKIESSQEVAPNGAIEASSKPQSEEEELYRREIKDLLVARNDQIFVTLTTCSLTVWQCRPLVVLAVVNRSMSSLSTYGVNVKVCLRPDSAILVVQTAHGYLMTYSIESSPNNRVYRQQFGYSQSRRESLVRHFGIDEGLGVREISVHFRRAIKIDAGISAVLALENELVVATTRPPAMQCIRWNMDQKGSHFSTELLSKMEWIIKKSLIVQLIHDRGISLSVWIALDGRAYVVQRTRPQLPKSGYSSDSTQSSQTQTLSPGSLFRGYCFHDPSQVATRACLAAINARFSLLAVNCENGEIWIYAAKDYVGNIPLSHKMLMPVTLAMSGRATCLTWSPDGYCLLAGFEKGWAMWSVFGKQGASSFTANYPMAEINEEQWLLGISTASWTAGGAEVIITSARDDRIWKLDISRSAGVGCLSCANLVRALLQTSSELVVYRGHDLPDLTSISNDASLWHHAQYPSAYLHNQGPIRSCVISPDGHYIAIAGRRGLAHYSVQSGRWKTFDDSVAESSFAVKGGMCWFGHILVAATESEGSNELRLYSRENKLGNSSIRVEVLPAPVIFIGPSGEESLLVYTRENILYHYVLNITPRGFNMVSVGQIAFHGVVRAPTRVRSVSWVLPDTQLRNGDPSRDVEFASVLFLVDDKLVLLQPSSNAEGGLKYDMRVIAQHVEYYILMRDQVYFNFANPGEESTPPSPPAGNALHGSSAHHCLRDSLWTFNGEDLLMWNDVREVLRSTSETPSNDLELPLSVPLDFYPLSILLSKGVVLGIESELIQRHDINFAHLRTSIRTHLFIPYILRHHLHEGQNAAAALALANQYEQLSYFAHTLEILLHNVLDDEANDNHSRTLDNATRGSVKSSLPSVLSFLQSSLPKAKYLSTIVQCIRKTELSSWRTLFDHLPSPVALFEQALELDDLNTASGYLIVLQGMEEAKDDNEYDAENLEVYVVRLMRLAKEKGNFELCAELARFMIALDPRGKALRRVIGEVGFHGSKKERSLPYRGSGLGLQIPKRQGRGEPATTGGDPNVAIPKWQPTSTESGADYFSASPGEF